LSTTRVAELLAGVCVLLWFVNENVTIVPKPGSEITRCHISYVLLSVGGFLLGYSAGVEVSKL
jgi:hypothetical protein